MPRFAQMLTEEMKRRGHTVALWTPQAFFFGLPVPVALKKWMGYVDQFIVFPIQVKHLLKACSSDTLFVFTDHALGPWVPMVKERPHVIHCHDFLAQRSAMGQIPENPTSWSGRQYQAMIRRGYSKGKYFISVSEKTREDLHQFLPELPSFSEVVHNGFNQSFKLKDPLEARICLKKKIGLDLKGGYLLHVGGNQWYKNRVGVIEIYNAWRSMGESKLPLLLIGKKPCTNLQKMYELSPFKEDIVILCDVEDEIVRLAYAGASVFVFPSLAEGFGWPIAEAMASGCPVITTNEAPMTIVAGSAGFLIPRKPPEIAGAETWAIEAARVVSNVLGLSVEERKAASQAGLLNSRRFNRTLALDRIEKIYNNILQTSKAL